MFESFDNVSLAGMCAAVPENIVRIEELIKEGDPETAFTLKRVAALAGLKQRHVAPPHIYTGDLAVAAGKEALRRLDWEPASVDLMFMGTQTPDYLSPPMGYLVAAKIGLSDKCVISDISAGCPGMIHLAWLAAAQLNPGCRRALILSGDASSKVVRNSEIGNMILMGDAVGALALEYDETADTLSFNILSYPDTDLSLVNYGSGYRPVPGEMDGMAMDGNKITEFCLKRAPQCMEGHLQDLGLTLDDIDIFFLHQPNKMIIETLKRRLKVASQKIPTIFADYANCSSASMAINACNVELEPKRKMLAMFCAFGSGLSVGSMVAHWDPDTAFDIISVKEPEFAA